MDCFVRPAANDPIHQRPLDAVACCRLLLLTYALLLTSSVSKAVILAFLMTILLRFLARIVIWVVYYGLLVLNVGLMVWLWVLYAKSNAEVAAAEGSSVDAITSAKRDTSIFL